MTEPQRRFLSDLCERQGVPFDATLSKADAAARIAELNQADMITPAKVRAIRCPGCGAAAGQPCIRESHHQARVDAGSRTSHPAGDDLDPAWKRGGPPLVCRRV